MAKPKDPRAPKKNSSLSYIDQLMRHSWSAYRETKEHEKKREYLSNLRARIDEWLAEPELIFDLAKGRSPTVTRECWSKISPANAAFPFDDSGDAQGAFFWFAYRASSELFTEVQVELDEVKYCMFGRCGYVVTLLEKVFATDNETSEHFLSDATFERHAKSASADKHHELGRYVVLADPVGHREGHTMTACSAGKLEHAKKRARELAERFNVRFLVARVAGSVDAH